MLVGGCACAFAAFAALAAFLAPRVARAQTEVVIVSGLGGEPVYSKRFAAMAAELAGALHARFGIADSSIVWVGEDSVHVEPHYGGLSTKVNIERYLRRAAGRTGQFVVVLIGHGSGDGAETRISVPGPDPTAADFAKWLGAFGERRTAIVNLTSASGDAIATLSAPNRVVITATKSSFERNESHFGEYFVHALSADGADTDKDGRVSLLEAFRYAARETARLYENASHLQTEHAQLDDDGDHAGTAEPTGRSGEGMLARRFFFDAGRGALASADRRVAALYVEQSALEEQVDGVRAKKATMVPEAYDAALEPLLVSLARKAREIRQAEGRP